MVYDGRIIQEDGVNVYVAHFLTKPMLFSSACNAGGPSLVPGLGRSLGEGNSNPLQYSCLENSMDKEPGRLQSIESHRVGPE